MLSEVFRHLCTFQGVLRADNVAEWTRGFSVPEYRERGIGPIKGQICGTVMKYCLKKASGGSAASRTSVPDGVEALRMVGSSGRNPELVAGRWCVAAFFDVTADTRDRALGAAGLDDSILVHRGPYRPSCRNPTSACNGDGMPLDPRVHDTLEEFRGMLQRIT